MPLPKFVKNFWSGLIRKMQNIQNRETTANLLMAMFIILCTIGAFLIYIPAGFIVAGACCGFLGLLLGLELLLKHGLEHGK